VDDEIKGRVGIGEPDLLTVGHPSTQRIRPINVSACFISWMTRFSIAAWSRSSPRSEHVSDWTLVLVDGGQLVGKSGLI
jgi:hypothetical protein